VRVARGFVGALIAAAWLYAATPAVAQAWRTVPAPPPMPAPAVEGWVAHDGADLWFAAYGAGDPVILLHPGRGNSDLWGGQAPALVAGGHRVIVIDARGHGRSTMGEAPLAYDQMESDVVAVMDALHLPRAAVVGWSDGAIVALVLAMKDPDRASRIFAFGANMDLGGLRPLGLFAPTGAAANALLERDYRKVSPTPDRWEALSRAVGRLESTEPSYSEADLAAIHGPRIAIADGDHEEFIRRAHTLYLAHAIPGAQLIVLKGVSHFAPLQDPAGFNASVLGFLDAP
jgi:pimeloyl-ACP methyl ester carboxylesterase